jgi:hypothetical protein
MGLRLNADRCRRLALLLPLLLAACGEQEATPNSATCPDTARSTPGQLDRFELALARARDRSLPLLVLVRPPHTQCPPADRLEGILRTTPGLEARCSFVVGDGGPAAGEDERRLVTRARAGAAFPPLLVIATAQGEILHIQVSKLMPYYAATGEPLAQDPGPLLTGQEVLTSSSVQRPSRPRTGVWRFRPPRHARDRAGARRAAPPSGRWER